MVGMRAAEMCGRAFLDFDAEIERREGKTISEIFAEYGEHFFRRKERALTEDLRRAGGMMLAPGGGWITDPEVVAMLHPPGRLVYLRVKPETAIKRMGKRQELRPLLARDNPLEMLRLLHATRRVLYERADVVIESERLSLQEVTEQVVALANELR